ncbi:MAG: CocE/NonD family hydrolase [Bacteroidaceae bacterium]|nr:CocE/NonD family hydrolase [Bacteroidaceae bacterium]
MRKICLPFLLLLCVQGGAAAAHETVDKAWVQSHYQKKEAMVAMRDGVKLYTAVYTPRQPNGKRPVLLRRTPYGCAYGQENWESSLWKNWHRFVENGYTVVFQDVRGKGLSEGQFVDIRPLLPPKHGAKEFDEATDTYDTAEWLMNHVPENNGCLGLLGSSYAGFYAMQGLLSGHPSIKAAVPQAPILSWFRGDDFHRNGAFFLRDAFGFTNRHCRVRPGPAQKEPKAPSFIDGDEYSFYLQHKTLANLTALLAHEVPFWDEMAAHPDEDAWWQARDYRNRCRDIRAAVMVVGGLWDAEDFYGTCQLYEALVQQNPESEIFLTLGPWQHGGWNSAGRNYLGDYAFGDQDQALYYQDSLEFVFLDTYLNKYGPGKKKSAQEKRKTHAEQPALERVHVFLTGQNRWLHLGQWPSRGLKPCTLYLHAGGRLDLRSPQAAQSCSQYVSHHEKPVPFMDGPLYGRPASYMTADQRFAGRRPDVLTFQTAPLSEDMTFMGDIQADLRVAVSTTDADFVVKVLDIYPDDYHRNAPACDRAKGYQLNGYQLPVRMDIMRGRYRSGFSQGRPFRPGEVTQVSFSMQRIAHTFRKGHRIGVQIQSSWFPLSDMNPQQFVDPYTCSEADFRDCQVSLFHQAGAASSITMQQYEPSTLK